MLDFFLSLKEQIGSYFYVFKFFIYFCIGSILILILQKVLNLSRFLLKRFNKDFFLENIKLFFNFILFVFISIILGWIVMILIIKKISW